VCPMPGNVEGPPQLMVVPQVLNVLDATGTPTA
jgi:hypothetical protein